MLYVFTSTEGVVKPEDLKTAVRNMGIKDAHRLPIPHNEFWSERQIFDNVGTRFSKFCGVSERDYYTFTMKSIEFDMIRVLVKKGVILCGVIVVVFGDGGELIRGYGIDEDGHCDIYGDYDIFDTHHDVLSELL